MAKILVVDDEAHIRRLAQVFLERAGYDVVTVQDPFTTLEMVRDTPPDLILMDFTLPGLNGGEVYEQLRQNPLTHPIPVVVLGARAADASVFQAQDEYLLRLGVPVLHKPFDPLHLRALVRDLLATSRPDRGTETSG